MDQTRNTQEKDPLSANLITKDIKNLIHVIRGKQVMLDSDLAELYEVETSILNRAVKRNKKRFPEDFCFQLTPEEFLRCQIGISKDNCELGRGGRRYLPYVFTEQGISMLSAVLRSEVAINVSIGIIRAFVEMRKFLVTNSIIMNRVDQIEFKQLEYQKSTDDKFNRVFRYIDEHAESEQKIFFDGQIYDAFSLITSIIRKASKEIILIDGYADIDTLNILAKKNPGVDVKIYTYSSAGITNNDISNFNAQYPTLIVKKTQVFHDRFIIIDRKTAYHIGASIKDAGKKCFAISLLQDPGLVADLLSRLHLIK